MDSLKGKLDDPTADELIEVFQVFSRGTLLKDISSNRSRNGQKTLYRRVSYENKLDRKTSISSEKELRSSQQHPTPSLGRRPSCESNKSMTSGKIKKFEQILDSNDYPCAAGFKSKEIMGPRSSEIPWVSRNYYNSNLKNNKDIKKDTKMATKIEQFAGHFETHFKTII